MSSSGFKHHWWLDVWHWVVLCLSFTAFFAVSFGNLRELLLFDEGGVSGFIKIAGILSFVHLFVFYFLGPPIHEFGHAIAAWAAGWRVHLILVWRIAYLPRLRKFELLSVRPHPNALGCVLATPADPSQWGRGAIPYLAGGAAANLLFGIACFVVAAIGLEPSSTAYVGLVWVGQTSIILAFQNLVPIWMRGHLRNDGALLLSALRGQTLTRFEQLGNFVGSLHIEGRPVAEWDRSVREMMGCKFPSTAQVFGPLFFLYALQSGDLVTAQSMLGRIPEPFRRKDLDFCSAEAFLIALLERDGARASDLLEGLPKRRKRSSLAYWRARCVIQHLHGERERALAAVAQARSLASMRGAIPFEKDEELFRAIETGGDLPNYAPGPDYVSLKPYLNSVPEPLE